MTQSADIKLTALFGMEELIEWMLNGSKSLQKVPLRLGQQMKEVGQQLREYRLKKKISQENITKSSKSKSTHPLSFIPRRISDLMDLRLRSARNLKLPILSRRQLMQRCMDVNEKPIQVVKKQQKKQQKKKGGR